MQDTIANSFAHLRFGVRTDVGRKRRNNEDAHGEWPARGVFCVADGMGGLEAGEVASRMVVEAVGEAVGSWEADGAPMPQSARLASLEHALAEANERIRVWADAEGKKGCGSTFVGVCLDPGDASRATALHAGDSRVYRVRGRRIVRITRDHSVATAAGVRDERDLNPAFRSLVLRAVGVKDEVEPERTSFSLEPGDWILVCSDGLSRMADDRSIARVLASAPDPDAAADALVDLANDRGGKDNVTALAIRVGPVPPFASGPSRFFSAHRFLSRLAAFLHLGRRPSEPEPASTT